ncbi:MAG: FG-GAP-like repeat-containing protein [Candidatus Magasanikbacteria bacterium]|nr:FG-GAP-like repeat-containing protein [Candidatus Magasanikbacteria bacterium]
MKSNQQAKYILATVFALVLGVGFLVGSQVLAQTLKPSDLGLVPIGEALGMPATDLRLVVARIIRVALSFLGILALGLMVYAGFLWMTAGGNEERIQESKKMMINAVIGLAIILSSYAIVSFVISKLVEATTDVPAHCSDGIQNFGETGVDSGGPCGGGGISPYFTPDLFYVEQLPGGGILCLRNAHPVIVFNRGVALDASLQQNITIEKAGLAGAVPGAWQYAGNKHNVIEFVPQGSCAPEAGNDCLAPSTTYSLGFKDTTKIKAEDNPNLVLNCAIRANCRSFVSFTTGGAVDRLPPAISIEYPSAASILRAGDTVPVRVGFSDDNGLQNISLYSLEGQIYQGAGSFEPAQNYLVASGNQSSAQSVHSADLNGDDKLDLLVGGNQTSSAAFFKGNGDGTFRLDKFINLGFPTYHLVGGDFNGDGREDLVSPAGFGGGNLGVVLGNGDGTFRRPTLLPVRSGATFVLVTDLNNDQKLDLVATRYFNNTLISVLLGNGDGTFKTDVIYQAGTAPTRLASADLNGDGKVDLAVADGAGSAVQILLGKGDGTFQDPVAKIIKLPGGKNSNPSSLALADVNRDGQTDLVVTHWLAGGDVVSAHFGKGDATFGAPAFYPVGVDPNEVVVSDVNADGHPDLIVSLYQHFGNASLNLLLNQGNGTFSAPDYFKAGLNTMFDITSGDFNGDGVIDIAGAYVNNTPNLLSSNLAVWLGSKTRVGGQPFLVGSQSLSGCQASGTVEIAWPTINLRAATYTLEAIGLDWAAQAGSDSQIARLRSAHCFDTTLDKDLGEGEAGPPACGGECGACSDSSCTSDQDCASGWCEITPPSTTGVCVDKMRITEVSPLSGAAGTYVSLSGYYFGNEPGQVYFANRPNPNVNDNTHWVEAPLLQCAAPIDNWIQWQILVTAPPGLSGDVPLKVITPSTTGKDGKIRQFTDVTYDAWGPKIPNYVFNNLIRPGLCAVLPRSQTVGGAVSLYGKNLGTLDNPKINKVLFGQTAGTVNNLITQNGPQKGNVNWTDTIINEVFVPALNPGVVAVRAVNKNGIDSNGVRFSIDSGSQEVDPVIYTINPDNAARGDYITITGKNFGANLGNVMFYDAADKDHNIVYNGDFTFPKACGSGFWTPNQIIVKFNASQGAASTTYLVRVRRDDDGKFSLFDNNKTFTLVNGPPAPGICKLDPAAGPVPLPKGASVKAIGENFGNAAEVYFWKAGASATTTIGRVKANFISSSTFEGANIIEVTPVLGTESGPVIVLGNNRLSNNYNFTVNDCTARDTCAEINAVCCSNGFEKGICKPQGQLCLGGTRASSYIWRFATKDIPAVPHVVERCDAATEAGLALPSPTPNILWDKNDSGDHHNVCRNAVIDIEFSTLINSSTINSSSVAVYRCISVEGNTCQVYDGVNQAAAKVALDPSSFVLKQSFGGPNGNSRHFLELKRNGGAVWPDRFWYQVVLGKTIKSAGAVTTSLFLATDRPCDPNSAYCFVFKTDSTDCKMRKVVVTPYAFWTEILEKPIRQRVGAVASGDLVYLGNGLSTQRCIMMDVSGYNWSWNTSNTYYGDMWPTSTVYGREAKAAANANTVAVGLVNPDNAVNVNALAVTNSLRYDGHSPLTIDLSKPEVKNFWPNCQEACTNAEVGAEFNIAMANVNVNWSSIHLQRCLDENCLAIVDTTTNTLPSFTLPARKILTIPHSILSPNTFYRVVLSATSTPSQQLWSAGNLWNPAATSSPYKKQFIWRFKTKKDQCLIDRVEVAPAEFFAEKITDRSMYGAAPYSAPDACSTIGQRLDPWQVGWLWKSSDVKVASVAQFSSRGKSPFCTNACIRKGSDVPAGVSSYIPVCGNGLVEAGEDCDKPMLDNGCGLDCRFLGKSKNSVCGNGKVELGEACDPKDAASTIGCSADCRHLGSNQQVGAQNVNASVCGNGYLGSGEDCDLGIEADAKVTSSSLGCSEKCLHLGTRLSAAWCQSPDAVNSGFTVNERKIACALAFSQCGDGETSRDEDAGCDLGNGKRHARCNDKCLATTSTPPFGKCALNTEGCDERGQYAGSSLLYSDPSVCGDTIQGIGEDLSCEDINFIIVNHLNLVDPWALAIGIGRGTPTGTPIAQRTDISAETNQLTKGGTIKGAGKFIIACGFKSDQDCAAVYGQDFGVGYNSCCYQRPHLISSFPVDNSDKVCRNTAIEAVFDTHIDPATLDGNVVLARGFSNNAIVYPPVTYHALILNGAKNAKGLPAELSAPTDIKVVGNYAYVAVYGASAFEVLDVKDPAKPEHVATIRHGQNGAELVQAITLDVEGNYAYVAGFQGGAGKGSLEIIDISDPTTPKHAAALKNGDQGAALNGPYSIDVDGNFAYVASAGGLTVQIIDVSDKQKPTPKGVIKNVGGGTSVIFASNTIYLGTANGIEIFDVTDKNAPVKKPTIVGTGAAYNMALFGNYLYVPHFSGNRVDIVDLALQKVVGTIKDTLGGAVLKNPHSVKVAGNYLFVTNYGAPGAFEVIDITNKANPKHAAVLKAGEQGAKLLRSEGLDVSGNFAYIAGYGDNAIEIMNVGDFVNQKNPLGCITDVTGLIAKNNSGGWLARLSRNVAGWIRGIFGIKAEAVIIASRWCVGNEGGLASVVTDDATTTSWVVIQLTDALASTTDYAVIFKEGLRSAEGVRLATNALTNKSFNSKFTTGADICTVKTVGLTPATYIFSRVAATTTLRASALASGGVKIQSIKGVYDWNYLWEPLKNDWVILTNTTSDQNLVTAQNRNGELFVSAAANILNDIVNNTSGPVATGRSFLTVFLCENPWPPRGWYVNNAGPFDIFPYEDKLNGNDGFFFDPKRSASDTFDNTSVTPARSGSGYFNFRTYYCADQGKTGKLDDLPYLKPSVQTSTEALVEPEFGSCEYTGNVCKVNNDCGNKYATDKGDYVLTNGNTGICGVTTSSPKSEDRYYQGNSDLPVQCKVLADCKADTGFVAWASKIGGAQKCFNFTETPKALSCYKYPPLKRFLFTNPNNDDVVGIQVFANPLHLTAEQWYKAGQQAGGRGFSGQAQTLPNGIGGNPAAGDGNNIYIDALNYVSSSVNNKETGSLYSNIYLLSINSNPKPETRQVFDQLLKNLKLNVNLTDFGYCGQDINTPEFKKVCVSDLDCPAKQVCAAQVSKLKRDYQRLRDLKLMEAGLESYAAANRGQYPEIAQGSFLKNQTLSTWPSWTVLGSAVGFEMPKDPINQLGLAGTCASNTAKYCLSDEICGLKKNTNINDTCAWHDAKTGWSIANQRFSFACASTSLAYRYLFSTSTGYEIRPNFEDVGLPLDDKQMQSFVNGFDFVSTTRLGLGENKNYGPGICEMAEEITTFNAGRCGDRIINWANGEKCDPPGALYYGECTNNKVQINICDQKCQWVVSTTKSCADVYAKCDNGIVEVGEACDDGKLNGTYNHCDKGCKSFGKAGFCGDGSLQDKPRQYEMCDPSTELVNGNIGWCVAGKNFGIICKNDANCNTVLPNACQAFVLANPKYALAQSNSCNFDCQSRGPYCGNGIVEAQYGEECDGAAKCEVGGNKGTRACNATCHFTDSAAAGWWRFEDIYDAPGNSAYTPDSARFKFDAYFSDPAPDFVKEARGNSNALLFKDGVYAYAADFPPNFRLNPTTSLSVEAWINPSDYDSSWMRVAEKGGYSKGGGYSMQFLDMTGRISFMVFRPGFNNHFRIESSVIVTTNQWTHVVGAYHFNTSTQDQTLTLYINGELDKNASVIIYNGVDNPQNANTINDAVGWLTPSAEPLYIGRSSFGQQFFHGLIDEVKVYDRALSLNEVKDHYNNSWSCNVAPSAPVAVAPGECGDGKVAAKEACDNGNLNGVACNPSYGKPCSYCAFDCKNVVDVEPAQYCGNAVIESKEYCEVDNVTGQVYGAGDGAEKWWSFERIIKLNNDVRIIGSDSGFEFICNDDVNCPSFQVDGSVPFHADNNKVAHFVPGNKIALDYAGKNLTPPNNYSISYWLKDDASQTWVAYVTAVSKPNVVVYANGIVISQSSPFANMVSPLIIQNGSPVAIDDIKIYNRTLTQAEALNIFKLGTALDPAHNAYAVLQCSEETTAPGTFKKGVKQCINACSVLNIKETNTGSCLVCGRNADGVKVSGNIINVLDPGSNDPLYNNNQTLKTCGAYLDLFFLNANSQLENVAGINRVPGTNYTLMNGSDPALINSNPLCSNGTPHYKMTINVDYRDRSWDFQVLARPDPWQNDLIVSPVISKNGVKSASFGDGDRCATTKDVPNSERPNDIRVVVSWIKGHDLFSGFVEPDVAAPRFEFDGISMKQTTGPTYFDSPDNFGRAAWYHGSGETLGQTSVESYTINTASNGPAAMATKTFKFFVRTVGPEAPISALKGKAKLKVEIYYPEDTGATIFYNLFSRPNNKVYYFDLAEASENPSAPYWEVFNIRRADYDAGTLADITKRIAPIQTTTTLANGRVATDAKNFK